MNKKYPRLLRPAICLVLIGAAALAGCHKKPVVVAPAPMPPFILIPAADPDVAVISPANFPVLEVIPPIDPPVEPAVIVLESAGVAFSSGDYRQAAKNFEEYLRLAPEGDKRDQALFELGLIYALPKNPSRDWQRGAAYLKQLVSDFPESPWKPAADLILSLHGEVSQLTSDSDKRDQRIRQLSTELERLKQIDAARRKRP